MGGAHGESINLRSADLTDSATVRMKTYEKYHAGTDVEINFIGGKEARTI